MICVGKLTDHIHRSAPLPWLFHLASFVSFSLSLFAIHCLKERESVVLLLRSRWGWMINLREILLDVVSVLAIVPIEYFNDRNGTGTNSHGSKLKSLNEENRV